VYGPQGDQIAADIVSFGKEVCSQCQRFLTVIRIRGRSTREFATEFSRKMADKWLSMYRKWKRGRAEGMDCIRALRLEETSFSVSGTRV
jgi:hypothetical protein